METVAFVQQRLQEEVYRLSGVKVEPPAIARPTPKGAATPATPAPGAEPAAGYRQPDGSFQPSGTSAFRPGKRPPGNAEQRRAVEVLKDVIPDESTPATSAATPESPYKAVKPGTLK